MTLFTDSPYEKMMTQVPTEQREATGPPAFPPGHPCLGCSYGRDVPCLGVCYRKLMGRSNSSVRKNSLW